MFFIKKIVNFTKDLVKIIFITFFLLLGIDFLFGEKILKFIDPYIKETEFYDKRVRVGFLSNSRTKSNKKKEDYAAFGLFNHAEK